MKAVDIVQIIEVVGPFIIKLVELLLAYFGSKTSDEEIAQQTVAMMTISGNMIWFEDEHGTRFSWPTDALEDAALRGFIRGIIAAKRQAGG